MPGKVTDAFFLWRAREVEQERQRARHTMGILGLTDWAEYGRALLLSSRDSNDEVPNE